MKTCTRRLEFDAGHRVLGHQGKCRFPHGHRYRVDITAAIPELDDLGMVVDFGVIKQVCGRWIDDELDHGFIVNVFDHELLDALQPLTHAKIKVVDFNPTSENLAWYMLLRFEELLIRAGHTDLVVEKVRLYETPNCWSDALRSQ